MKLVKNIKILDEILKIAKNFSTKICKIIEFGAVRRNDNLVDLEKRCKMSIWTQKSASLQPRTRSLKISKHVAK